MFFSEAEAEEVEVDGGVFFFREGVFSIVDFQSRRRGEPRGAADWRHRESEIER